MPMLRSSSQLNAPLQPTTAPAEEPISTAKQEEDIQQAVAEPRNEVVDKAVADGLEELLGGSSTPSSAPAQSQ